MAAQIAQLAGAGINIYGAGLEQQELEKQADNLMKDADANDKRLSEYNRKFLAEQEVAYGKSGVILDGSPLLVLEETRQMGLEDRVSAKRQAFNQSQNLRAQGRNRMLSAIGGGMASGMNAMSGMGGGGSARPSAPSTGGYSSSMSPYASGNSRISGAGY